MAGRRYTTREAAARLRRSPRTLEDWRADRKGPPYIDGVPVLYREEDLDAWEQAQLVVPRR